MKSKNPFHLIRNMGMQTKLVLICVAIIVPVFLASVYLIIGVQSILDNYAVNDLRNVIDSAQTRFSGMLSNVENEAWDKPLSELEKIDSATVYYENDQRVETVKNTPWYQQAESTDTPFWSVIENDSEFIPALIYPARDEYNKKVIAVIPISAERMVTAAKPFEYPVILTLSNGSVVFSNREDIHIMDRMYVPFDDSVTSVVQDNFFYGTDFTVTTPFTTEDTETTFRIYMTVPYNDLTAESRNVTLIYVWYVGLCLILSILLSILLTGFFARRISFLKRQMIKVSGGDFELSDSIKGEDEIYELYGLLQQMVNSIMVSNTETTQAKLQAETFRLNQVEAEFKALASQINPHFLYNTLETIRMKAYSNDDRETAELLKVLGKFMRRSLAVKDGLVTLTSEVDFTHNYLKLQYARFGDRVSFNILIEPDGQYMILPLIIQPLVENAYAHGVEKVKQGGYILIAIKNAGKNVIIEVTDNGGGMDKETLTALREKIERGDTSSGKSIGLTNVHMRIKKYFGNEYGMQIFSELGKGTMIKLVLPRDTGGMA
jgi:two-component system sensor histidine kinase YesM